MQLLGLKGNVLELLQDAINKNRKHNTLCIKGQYYSYQQLLETIGYLRYRIRCIDEKTVGLVINDDMYTYASILALWMEGKAYVPLHPLQPLLRCEDILNQVGTHTIIDSSEESRYSGHTIIWPDKECSHPECFYDPVVYGINNLAYILFTSGSTGTPKGVCITIGNVEAFEESFFDLGISLTTEDRCLQMFDLTFDMSVGSFVAPLLCGSCLYTIAPGKIKWQEVFRLMDQYHITEAQLVPSVIHYLHPYFDEIDFPFVRYVLFAGEGLPADEVSLWQQCIPNAKIWNVYGPTENTVYSTFYLIPHHDILQTNGIVCIGKAMKHVRTRITDGQGQTTPAGEKGELCLAGEQLTPGYWRNNEMNREAFFIADGERWYRTGDVCSLDKSGNLLYYGRKDAQVQIQGYRVELSEIEHVARKFFTDSIGIVALAEHDSQGNATSIALVLETDDTEKDNLLMQYLGQYLPHYMLPSRICHIGQFPQNMSNKIDRKKIAETINKL